VRESSATRDTPPRETGSPAVKGEGVVSVDQVLPLLRQVFGTQVELAGCRVGNRQHDYMVLLVELRRPSVRAVMKLAGPEAALPCPFDRTAMLHQVVSAGTDIRMPEVLAVDTSYRDVPWRYFIKSYTPGQEWAVVRPQLSPEELSDAFRQIGRAVALLHSIRFPSFGELAADGGVVSGRSYLAALAEHARQAIKSARLSDLFSLVLERHRALFLDLHEASLCHEDLHQHNILFEHRLGRWHLATILDFDKAWAGHHETDLARLDLWRGMSSREFWESYETIRPVEPLYQQRRPIHQLLWCLEYARPTAEHLADTRRVCAELGLPPLKHFP